MPLVPSGPARCNCGERRRDRPYTDYALIEESPQRSFENRRGLAMTFITIDVGSRICITVAGCCQILT